MRHLIRAAAAAAVTLTAAAALVLGGTGTALAQQPHGDCVIRVSVDPPDLAGLTLHRAILCAPDLD